MKAILLTALLPLHAMALMPVADLKPTRPVSKTVEILTQDPLLVHQLGLADDEKNALMDEVLKANENGGESVARPDQEEPALLIKANFFEQLFGGSPQPQAPQYDPRQQRPAESAPAPRQAVKLPQAPDEPAIVFDHDSMRDPNDWKVKYFDVVVVINKAASGQTAYVYQKNAAGVPQIVLSTKVSTGREGRELSNSDRRALGMGISDHAPNTSYFSNTPTGYWTPIRFSIDHVSGDWEDAAMDHAVFFHPRGIATHKAPNGTEAQLGRRASGACVRMSRADAREVFWIIRQTGGPVTAGELAGGNFERSSPGPSFARELSQRQAKGFSTYETTPEIPNFDRNGNVKMALDTEGKPVLDTEGKPMISMRKALARTLIVVENRPLARPAPRKNDQ